MTNPEIVFITSSRTKLAHARYLVREYPITIAKQKNYGIGYVEPRIYDREQLLSESYKDALERFTKNVSNPDEKFFIIEDTSVVIDALSENGEEVPGLDIKYWMKEHTFEMLDELLKAKRNNRKCSVRSDIVLHLPKKLREKYDKEYIQFTGISEGEIVAHEHDYLTNPSYPWLDNKTFNKWFAPEGNMPIGMMTVQKAAQYDFRKKAFDALLIFLETEEIMSQTEKSQAIQGTLPLYFENLILVGPTCAGKSTLASYLSKHYGYFHLEASDFMHQKFHELHGVNTDVTIGNFAQKALLENPCIVAELIAKQMDKFNDIPTIISGFRNPQEIECFLKQYNSGVIVVYIDADIQIRFARSLNRKRPDDVKTLEEFQAKDHQQQEMGLAEMLISYRDQQLLNEKGFEDFYREFENYYINILPEKNTINETLKLYGVNLKLEEAIIIAMHYDMQSGQDYTTTELSTLILNQLGIKKSKNNISRYFNQNFHPYFDAVKGIPIKYKINSTGASMAQYLIKKHL